LFIRAETAVAQKSPICSDALVSFFADKVVHTLNQQRLISGVADLGYEKLNMQKMKPVSTKLRDFQVIIFIP